MWYKYDGTPCLTTYRYDGTTIEDSNAPEIASYWLPNYSDASSWLMSHDGVKGIIVTDTHYGAGKAQFTNSQAVRSAKRIQKEQGNVLFLHLGDIVDNGNTELTRFEDDGCALFKERNIYISGNHERQEGRTDREGILTDYMDGITILDSDLKAFYRDYGNMRFICINSNFSGSGALYSEIQTAIDTTPQDSKIVFLSHYTPKVRDNYTLTLSIFENIHNMLAPLGSRFIGHWTGHQHIDDYYRYDNGVDFATMVCDYCNADHATWRQPRTLTEGAMTCFCIGDSDVEFARFGGIENEAFREWSYTI